MKRWRFRVPERAATDGHGSPTTFSVVIPVHNGAHFIGGAIASALAQTERPLDVVVVDDGSTDDLEGALRDFTGSLSVARFPHSGLSMARNRGADLATGEFIVFLDCDDALEPEFLEALRSLAEHRPDLDVLTTDCYFERDAAVLGRFYDSNAFETEDQRRAMLDRCFITMMSAVRRKRYLAVGGCDPATDGAEDWHLWARLVVAGSRLGLVDAPLARYRLHGGQLTARRARSLAARAYVAERLCALDGITGNERRQLEHNLTALRARAAMAEARQIRNPLAARRALLRIALDARLPRSARMRGLVGGISPALVLRRRTS